MEHSIKFDFREYDKSNNLPKVTIHSDPQAWIDYHEQQYRAYRKYLMDIKKLEEKLSEAMMDHAYHSDRIYNATQKEKQIL